MAAAGSAPELLHQALNENGATGDLKSAVSIVKITPEKLGWPHLVLKSKLLSSRGREMDKDRIKIVAVLRGGSRSFSFTAQI